MIGHEHYGTSADWWGLGCLVYEMTAGQPPFRDRGERPNPPEMEKRIQTEKEEYSKTFSRLTKELCTMVSASK